MIAKSQGRKEIVALVVDGDVILFKSFRLAVFPFIHEIVV